MGEGGDRVPAEFQRGWGLMVWKGQVTTPRLVELWSHSGEAEEHTCEIIKLQS